MNAVYGGVRLYLGGITMISLSSYVQDVRLFLIHRKYHVLLKCESNDSYESKMLRKDAHLSGNATKVARS